MGTRGMYVAQDKLQGMCQYQCCTLCGENVQRGAGIGVGILFCGVRRAACGVRGRRKTSTKHTVATG